ncbi:EamA family transporter RarD [Desulfatitalea alkaliphila]|uniref:EamA family transporter RarD n=1 Tax=Desulfatitalea alkaliphila TaxID=2929485 RepID=A0AA41R0M8_9BACT|nr:EamA family transporter RarD [Desulfatitalea alkaliphila]MCJ8499794.1 EamA family transporter RarD [Desulfatitalea alkaliphila]
MPTGAQPAGSEIDGPGPINTLTGPAAALGAFGIWALFPVYFRQFGNIVTPLEILMHRMLWAALFLVLIVLVTRRVDRVRALFKRPRAILALVGSAVAVSFNWGTFIYAVGQGQILQSSLGYYINPLFNVFLGYCFLGERLHPMQRLAVGVAAAGVLISLVGYGRVPWLALILACSFGLYGLIRKQVEIDSITGLMVETLLLLPLAVGWLLTMHLRGQSMFGQAGLRIDLLLIGAGLATIVPLILFAVAARRLRLATLGILQYITPTGHFLVGVLLYGEPFAAADAVTFGCIWVGLALYTADMWVHHRKHLALK